MAPLYKPPTQVTTGLQPYEALVATADPAWARDKYWCIEYLTAKRAFFSNPYIRGAYSRLSNVYAVGQAYGGPDPLVIDNLKPTYAGRYVANAIPGLYQGVPDGKGWG